MILSILLQGVSTRRCGISYFNWEVYTNTGERSCSITSNCSWSY